MKRILITGANSYIGTSFEKYIAAHFPGEYRIDCVDMVDGTWREKSFSGYDSLFHVAGIAHLNSKQVGDERYYAVNRDLAVETAGKAKADGVRQFVFMSSASVYGEGAPVGKQRVITKDTPLTPSNAYGDSKLQAEQGILPLQDEHFRVVILRPPMIYGKGCKGNYTTLAKIAKKLPVFPAVENQRSMLYVDSLCEFVRLMVEEEESGVFWPQNAEYTNTSGMVKRIAAENGRSIRLVKGFSGLLKLGGRFVNAVNKAFGNFVYEQELSRYKLPYCVADLKQSIVLTERNDDK